MRKLVPALVAIFVATLGVFAPGPSVPAAAAASGPKVVLVVGATHDVTSTYRQRMDAAYAEAIKYTSNVVKVYSPNATWDKVKAALQGASIVVYMGHGNGFPSPYATTPRPATQNGFGLNKVAGQGDHNNVYYGEQYIANEIRLAPNAVVLLNHLCYASGNGEPGHAEPTLTVAKQRVDNYAAGFIKAGARAVIADGHMGPGYYIKSLFTTRQTIDKMWRAAPSFHNHAFSFASLRSPGYTAQMDPDKTTSGFYRSVTGRLDLLTQDVTGAAYAPTDGHPTALSVPGNAEVTSAGAPVFAGADLAGTPVATLPLGTRVRLLAGSGTGAAAVYQVATHDGTVTGFVAAANLAPRDSAAPQIWEVSGEPGVISPNGDGSADTFSVRGRVSETVLWRVQIYRDGTRVWSGSGNGTDVSATWGGRKDGVAVADGTYRWTLDTTDPWGNVSPTREGTVRVDTTAPLLSALSLPVATPATTFSPNGDGRSDTVALGWTADESGTVAATITNAAGSVVRSISVSAKAGTAGSLTWDGKSNAGAVVPDGLYTIRLAARDAAGNVGPAQQRTVAVFNVLSKVVGTPARFHPHDGDRFAPTTTLSLALTRTATVTWRVLTLDGTPVLTRFENASLPAGTHSFVWDGRDTAGNLVPAGMYAVQANATDGTFSIQQRGFVDVNPFTISLSNEAPVVGQTFTLKATSSEPISGKVVLHVTEPGIPVWATTMTLDSGLMYEAGIALKSSKVGPVTFRVSALDADGSWQASYKQLGARRGMPSGDRADRLPTP